MAKFDWGFTIPCKEQAEEERIEVQIVCSRTDGYATFALGKRPTAKWGDILYSNLTDKRLHDAECALSTWGWI